MLVVLPTRGGISTGTVDTISAVTDSEVAEHKAGGSTFMLQLTTGTATLLTGETPSRFQTKGGWEAQDLLYQADAANVKTHLVVSTDIQATTEKKVYSGTGTAIPDTAVITGDVPGDGSDFEVTINLNPADNRVPITAQIFCPDSATGGCAISVAEDGTIVENDEYEYRTATSTMETDDEDYLAWGFWVTGSVRDTLLTADGAAITADAASAGAFAYGSMPFAVVAGITGKAMYNGVANGLYSAGGMVQYFDADAMLEVNFGGATNTAPLAAISGSISNIMAAGQLVDGSLTLEKTDINAAGTIVGDDGGTAVPGVTDGVLGGKRFQRPVGRSIIRPCRRQCAGYSHHAPDDRCRHIQRVHPGRQDEPPGRIRRVEGGVSNTHDSSSSGSGARARGRGIKKSKAPALRRAQAVHETEFHPPVPFRFPGRGA